MKNNKKMPTLKEELKGFRNANPSFKFRTFFCKDSGEKVVQVFSNKEWMCLHGFYADCRHYKLGEGF